MPAKTRIGLVYATCVLMEVCIYVYVQLKLKRRNSSHNATKFNKVKLAIILAEENTKYFGMR